MSICTSAQSRKDGITFVGEKYKIEMIERKDGTIEFFEKKLPIIEQRENNKLASIPFIRGFVFFVTFKPIFTVWLLAVLSQLFETLSETNKLGLFNPAASSISLILGIILATTVIVLTLKTFGNFTKVYQYHGAEHKIIHALDKNLELTLENIRNQPRYHYRCGSILASFLVIIFLIFIAILPNVTIFFPIMHAIALEMFYINNGENLPVIKWFYKFGKFVQEKIVTKEPTDEMIKSSIIALEKLIELEKNS